MHATSSDDNMNVESSLGSKILLSDSHTTCPPLIPQPYGKEAQNLHLALT